MQLLFLCSVPSTSPLPWYDKRKRKEELINSATDVWKERGLISEGSYYNVVCNLVIWLINNKFENNNKKIFLWINLVCLSLTSLRTSQVKPA